MIIAAEPVIVLMDEPCSALDPIATAKVEELIDGPGEHQRGHPHPVVADHGVHRRAVGVGQGVVNAAVQIQLIWAKLAWNRAGSV